MPSWLSRLVLSEYGFRMMLLQMFGEQIISCRGPLVRPAQVADVPWAMLVPFVAIEALLLRKADIANTTPEFAVSSARRSILPRYDGRCQGDMTT